MKLLKINTLQHFSEEAAETAPAEVTEQAAPAEESAALPQSLLEALSERYQVAAGDLQALETAIREQMAQTAEEDDAQPDEEEQPEQAQIAAGAERIYDMWMEQAAQTSAVYPDFDLRQEMADPRFARLLRAEVDVRTAYEVLHKDEIIPAAMQYAARTVEQKLASALRSSGSRPSENGIRGASAAVIGSDVSHLSKRDYEEVCRRVARGERVSFG